MNNVGQLLDRVHSSFISKIEERHGKQCLPKRRYVHIGQVVIDCEQVVTSTGAITPGSPSAQGVRYGAVTLATAVVEIRISRDVPSMDDGGRAPTDHELTQAALAAGNDAAWLNDAYFAAEADGTLQDVCSEVVYNGIRFDGPEGGMLTTMLTLSFEL